MIQYENFYFLYLNFTNPSYGKNNSHKLYFAG